MSEAEKNGGRFYMGGNKENYTNLIVPGNPFTKDLENLKDEQAATEARELFLKLQREKQEELNARLEKLELLPMFNKVILLPYPVNPYKKIINGSIIVDYQGEFLNPESGEKDKLQELVACAKVIEVGPECKFLKPGDDIFYDPRTTYPVPFMALGYKLTTETQVLCMLNESLKERLQMN